MSFRVDESRLDLRAVDLIHPRRTIWRSRLTNDVPTCVLHKGPQLSKRRIKTVCRASILHAAIASQTETRAAGAHAQIILLFRAQPLFESSRNALLATAISNDRLAQMFVTDHCNRRADIQRFDALAQGNADCQIGAGHEFGAQTRALTAY